MNFFFAALLCSQAVFADFSASASAVKSAADDLTGKVNGFSSSDGIIGALGIQNEYPALSKAVVALSSAAADVSDSDVDPSGTSATASSIGQLLSALTEKADDFKSVGVTSIVKSDISNLQGPAVGIVSGILHAVSNDCNNVKSLTGALSSLENGFSSADSAYGISAASWPAAPSC